jgi:gamma-glutamyltranspeptidase/glutathione hydrolase
VRARLAVVLALLAGLLIWPGVTVAAEKEPVKQPVAVGTGGAVATVDPLASQAAIRVLQRGGNAVDAAIAAAAMLGVVEPYSCGIGGGGFMVIYRASDRSVTTVDSRETAPAAFEPDSFIDPNTGQPISFSEAVTSGLGVGVPGTLLGWDVAARRYGTMRLPRLITPAISVAAGGFTVDQTFRDQTQSNLDRFRDFTSTRAVFLTPSGDPYPVGSTFRNPDLAETYGLIADQGTAPFYLGEIADAIVETVQHPPLRPGATRNVRPGLMELGDLAAYRAPVRDPTVITYRGLKVYGMGPPSSGGSTVGEALNILEGYGLAAMNRVDALHYYLEASAFSFADRNQYLGDSDYVDVPLAGLLSDSYAAERRSSIGPTASTKPVPFGDPTDNEGPSTTHLTVADRWGNVVSYTFTIESIGGSGITVPGYGFFLNNELTDFNFTPGTANSPDGGKRPRSSMSPTIVTSAGKPIVAVGSPGGSMIITTVLQILINHLDFGMTLPEAIAVPRASQRNTPNVFAEPAFIASPEGQALRALGHTYASPPPAEIGAATGIAFFANGIFQAVAEPVRRGGGSAMVAEPAPAAASLGASARRARVR